MDPATGATYWSQRLLTSSEYAVSTPVFYKDRLLIGGLMLQLDPDKPAATVLWPPSKATPFASNGMAFYGWPDCRT